MNRFTTPSRTLLASALSVVLLSACSSTPTRMAGLEQAEHRLAQLQSDPELFNRAPLAIQQAEQALRAAEAAPRRDEELGAHLLFMAERKIALAWALAEARLMEDQREGLQQQNAAARVAMRDREIHRANRESDRARDAAERSADRLAFADERTQAAKHDAMDARSDAEAARDQLAMAQHDSKAAQDANQASARARDSALRDSEDSRRDSEAAMREAEHARAQAELARSETDAARQDADTARSDAAEARQRAVELQASIDALNARPTDRGWVVTLGDVLFATGRDEINAGATDHLNQLAGFLLRHPGRTAVIEGHTDDVGGASTNLDLSERRAESVKAFLVSRGVESSRLSASGLGEGVPVAGNESSTGRQQNRRVEVIISNADTVDAVSSTRS